MKTKGYEQETGQESVLKNFKTAMGQIVNGTPEQDDTLAEYSTGEMQVGGGYAMAETKGKTVIFEDVRITGDIHSKGDIDLFGTVKGNVHLDGHLNLHGAIEGNLTAGSAILQAGHLNGEKIDIKSDLTVGREFEMTAQTKAESIVVDGKISGNITVTELATLCECASVSGNISAGFVEIHKGAMVSGTLKVGHAGSGTETKASKKSE